MKNNEVLYEKLLFEYVRRIKNFNELLIKQFQLKDIPYNVSGKAFPKIGTILSDKGSMISYRFHGRGATFYEENIQVEFSIDTSSKYLILLSVGGFYFFLKTYLNAFDESIPVEQIMIDFENRGIFIQRKPSDLGTFHVNEKWHYALENNLPFAADNKHDIDWI